MPKFTRGKRKFRRTKRKRGRTFSKKVKAVINRNIEHKFIDQVISKTVVDTTAQLGQFVNPTQLDQQSYRIGDQITYTRINWNWQFEVSSLTNFNQMRVIIFTWNQLGAPADTDVLQNNSTSTVMTSPIRWDTVKAGYMKVMYDRVITVNEITPVKRLNLKFFGRRLPIKKIAFGTGSGYTPKQIWFFVVSDDAATPFPTYQYYLRVTYTDA